MIAGSETQATGRGHTEDALTVRLESDDCLQMLQVFHLQPFSFPKIITYCRPHAADQSILISLIMTAVISPHLLLDEPHSFALWSQKKASAYSSVEKVILDPLGISITSPGFATTFCPVSSSTEHSPSIKNFASSKGYSNSNGLPFSMRKNPADIGASAFVSLVETVSIPSQFISSSFPDGYSYHLRRHCRNHPLAGV